jgi:hypothetical protein
MPARRLRLKCHHVFTFFAVVFLVPACVNAQAGGSFVTLKGTVSETVALSVLPNLTANNIEMDVVSSGSTVQMTLSGTGDKSPVICVPLIVRSNSGFRISAVVESKTAELTQLSVIDVRPTGSLVSSTVISELEVPQQFELRGLDENASLTNSSSLDVSRPFLVLRGPRVSLGGTLDSPNNALQITLLIRVKPQPVQNWLVHLTFVGTAVPLIQ